MTESSHFTKKTLKWMIAFVLFIAWLGVSAILGAFLLSAKESLGINLFSYTGYHAFTACLQSQYSQAQKDFE